MNLILGDCIEKEPEYFKIAEARIAHYAAQQKLGANP